MTTTQQDPSIEFLSVTAETVSEALTESLNKIEAPQEVKDLADSLYALLISIEQTASGNTDDEYIQKSVLKAGRDVVKAGGILYSPCGNTPRREGTLLAG
jgi:hypothetical protein